ncbi:13574_t:CDS:2, partial [Funneliformis geosporum]
PSEEDFKEAIRIGYSEAISLAEYLQIDNKTAPLMQRFIYRIKHYSDNINNLEIMDDDDDQYQNLTTQQIKTENIGTAAFEVSQLLLDESDKSENFDELIMKMNLQIIY